jgi:CspA family cold shock protein
MHVEMALGDPLYVSQMAFATPLRSTSIVERLRAIKQSAMAETEWNKVRRTFLLYCFAQDRIFVRVPRDPMFEGQRMLRKDLSGRWTGGANQDGNDARRPAPAHSENQRSHVTAVVKWFDTVKGFGFIDAGLEADVFLHMNTLQRAGIQGVALGDVVVCDVGAGKEGKLQVIQVHSVEAAQRDRTDGGDLVPGEVLFYNPQKGFGFVRAAGFDEDIYISAALLQAAGVVQIDQGKSVRLIVGENIRGRGRAAKFLELA